jgi:hypothetical protein
MSSVINQSQRYVNGNVNGNEGMRQGLANDNRVVQFKLLASTSTEYVTVKCVFSVSFSLTCSSFTSSLLLSLPSLAFTTAMLDWYAPFDSNWRSTVR